MLLRAFVAQYQWQIDSITSYGATAKPGTKVQCVLADAARHPLADSPIQAGADVLNLPAAAQHPPIDRWRAICQGGIVKQQKGQQQENEQRAWRW